MKHDNNSSDSSDSSESSESSDTSDISDSSGVSDDSESSDICDKTKLFSPTTFSPKVTLFTKKLVSPKKMSTINYFH